MTDFYWSPRTRELLKKKPGGYSVLGITMDGSNLTVCGDAWNKPVQKEIVHKGARGFFVPCSLMAGQCGKDMTRREALAEYLASAITDMTARAEDAAAEPIFAAFALPQRDIWKRDQDSFLQFLDSAFGEKAPFVYPCVTSLPDVLLHSSQAAEPTLLISVETDWSEFALLSQGKVRLEASAAYGSGADPKWHRINDFLHNSTRKWQNFSAHSWAEGFQTILDKICGQDCGGLWPKKEMDTVRRALFVCSHQAASKALSGLIINGRKKICQRWEPSPELARAAKNALDSVCIPPSPSSTPGLSRKPATTAALDSQAPQNSIWDI